MSDTDKRSRRYKTILRKLVPSFLLKERAIYLRLGAKSGNTYARLRLLDAVGFSSSQRAVPKGARSFLFVCYGNIMRSPMAAALLTKELHYLPAAQSININSAGLHATPSKPPHPWALAVSPEFGVSLQNHGARMLTGEMVQGADAIFAMDFQNKAELLSLYPEAKRKIFMLSMYLPGREQNREIPDPYFGNVETTRDCYRVLQTCVKNLAADLFPPSNR